ncbi:hypothetical protein LXL04_038739 [Taraxacum kok-saghyz]
MGKYREGNRSSFEAVQACRGNRSSFVPFEMESEEACKRGEEIELIEAVQADRGNGCERRALIRGILRFYWKFGPSTKQWMNSVFGTHSADYCVASTRTYSDSVSLHAPLIPILIKNSNDTTLFSSPKTSFEAFSRFCNHIPLTALSQENLWE